MLAIVSHYVPFVVVNKIFWFIPILLFFVFVYEFYPILIRFFGQSIPKYNKTSIDNLPNFEIYICRNIINSQITYTKISINLQSFLIFTINFSEFIEDKKNIKIDENKPIQANRFGNYTWQSNYWSSENFFQHNNSSYKNKYSNDNSLLNSSNMFIIKKTLENQNNINYEMNIFIFIFCIFLINWFFWFVWLLIFLIAIFLRFIPIQKRIYNPNLVQQMLIWSIFKFNIWKKRGVVEKYFYISFKIKKTIILIVNLLEVSENNEDKKTLNITENTESYKDSSMNSNEFVWNIKEIPKPYKDSSINSSKTILYRKETPELYKNSKYWNIAEKVKITQNKVTSDWFFNVPKRSPLSFVWLLLSLLIFIFRIYIPFAIYIFLVLVSLIIVWLFFRNRREKSELHWSKMNIEVLIANIAFLLAFWQMIFIIFMLIKNPENISFFSI